MKAKVKPVRLEKHGDVRIDNYFWMRERDSADVLEYLRVQNEQTDQALKGTEQLQKQLLQEMRTRIKEDDSSVPEKDGNYFYYARFIQGKEYPIYGRKQGTLEAPEEILADINLEAKNSEFYQSTGPIMSPNHQLMAIAADTKGRRFYDFRFKDLKTGKWLPDTIANTTGNLVWSLDNRTVFYTQQDPETLRSDRLFRYELGSGRSPELVYLEKDETFQIQVRASKDQQMLLMDSHSTVSDEVRFVSAAKPSAEWTVLAPRERHHEYSVEWAGDRFFIVSNYKAKNFRVMTADLKGRRKEDWKELIAHRDEIFVESIDVYRDFFVLSERHQGLTRLSVYDRNSMKAHRVQFPDTSYVTSVMPLPNYEGAEFRYSYESLSQPESIYDFAWKTQKSELKKQQEVPTYDASLYVSERLWATAQDGTRIPISLIQRKDRPRQSGPLLLYGYGSYGFSMEPWFSSSIFSLVDRGFVYAIAHIRGGSEMGREWYESGKMHKKMNTFTDFIACAEHLVKEKYTSPEHLYAMGGSAGGLLMGAVMNLRPDLFHGVVAQVPFVDVISTMLDDSIPLTTSEYDEWGNPNKPEDYKYIRQYSPYDNVQDQQYPHLLAITGYHDSQVQYWEPAKWVAKLQDLKQNKRMVLLQTEMTAGHSGASGRFERLRQTALAYAFVLQLEMKR